MIRDDFGIRSPASRALRSLYVGFQEVFHSSKTKIKIFHYEELILRVELFLAYPRIGSGLERNAQFSERPRILRGIRVLVLDECALQPLEPCGREDLRAIKDEAIIAL